MVAGRAVTYRRGAVPDTTGITPSGVSKEAGRQGCRREVSAQERDVYPSASSEPANSPSQHPFCTRQHRTLGVYGDNRPEHCFGQSVSLGPNSSITIVFTLERALNLDTKIICMFLGEDGEQRTECRKVPCLLWLVELFRQEVDSVFAPNTSTNEAAPAPVT